MDIQIKVCDIYHLFILKACAVNKIHFPRRS